MQDNLKEKSYYKVGLGFAHHKLFNPIPGGGGKNAFRHLIGLIAQKRRDLPIVSKFKFVRYGHTKNK